MIILNLYICGIKLYIPFTRLLLSFQRQLEISPISICKNKILIYKICKMYYQNICLQYVPTLWCMPIFYNIDEINYMTNTGKQYNIPLNGKLVHNMIYILGDCRNIIHVNCLDKHVYN